MCSSTIVFCKSCVKYSHAVFHKNTVLTMKRWYKVTCKLSRAEPKEHINTPRFLGRSAFSFYRGTSPSRLHFSLKSHSDKHEIHFTCRELGIGISGAGGSGATFLLSAIHCPTPLRKLFAATFFHRCTDSTAQGRNSAIGAVCFGPSSRLLFSAFRRWSFWGLDVNSIGPASCCPVGLQLNVVHRRKSDFPCSGRSLASARNSPSKEAARMQATRGGKPQAIERLCIL